MTAPNDPSSAPSSSPTPASAGTPGAALRLHDSLRRKKVEFVPVDPEHVRLYVCGPTVYGLIHIGNARPMVAFDVAFRHLRHRFPKVTYVRNITDVDDKIIKRAAELGEEPAQLAARFTEEYRKDAASLCCLPPTVEPKVTDHIVEIVDMIGKLIDNGVAYAARGDVYFNVGAFGPYGELSGQPLEQLQAGARVEVDEAKKSPLDFALWKGAKPGEPFWPSPWGDGRPGWHIECSAMSLRHLGATFDIHGGGIDLVFPHHENERAQSQGALGAHTFARYWLHNGFVNFNDQKIAKSDERMQHLLKRAFQLRGLVDKQGGEAVRYFLLTTTYRNPINFEVIEEPAPANVPGAESSLRFPGLEEADRQLEYGYLTRKKLTEALSVGKAGPGALAEGADAWLGELSASLDDDFNTAGALAAVQLGLGLANRLLDGKLAVPKDVRRRTLERLGADLAIASSELGLWEQDPQTWLAAHRTRRCLARGIDAAAVEQKLVERAAARASKDFAQSDALRDALKAMGVEVMDGADGSTWRVAE